MNELVEQIVREVMSRLAGAGAVAAPLQGAPAIPAAAGPAATCGAAVAAPAGTAADGPDAADGNRRRFEPPAAASGADTERSNDQLHVPGKVVALADLADRLDRVRCVSVASGAVVTPAVRDELQRRRIALRYVADAHREACAAPEAAAQLVLQLVIHQGCFDDRAVQTLRIEGASVAVAASECVIEACDAAARAVLDRQALAVVITRYAAAAICLANRIPQVRAVAARDPAELKSAMSMVGANIVVIDPDAVGLYGARRLLREAAVIGRRTCPRVFGARLN